MPSTPTEWLTPVRYGTDRPYPAGPRIRTVGRRRRCRPRWRLRCRYLRSGQLSNRFRLMSVHRLDSSLCPIPKAVTETRRLFFWSDVVAAASTCRPMFSVYTNAAYRNMEDVRQFRRFESYLLIHWGTWRDEGPL